ncbi:MAG: DUF4102 domain-containing protein [Acidobacteria bacterium]|nr:DUF4102 domain-containing protein [Acidobacteriota bacterium]
MKRKRNALTDAKIQETKPKEKSFKLTDGGGLYLYISTTGAKLWRLDFRNSIGKWKNLSFGSYPEISIQDARQKMLEAKKQIRQGLDPAIMKRMLKNIRREKIFPTAEQERAIRESFVSTNDTHGLSPMEYSPGLSDGQNPSSKQSARCINQGEEIEQKNRLNTCSPRSAPRGKEFSARAKPCALYGLVNIEPSVVKKRLIGLSDTIISLIAQDPTAIFGVSLEIKAILPMGISDALLKALSEETDSNAFKIHELK